MDLNLCFKIKMLHTLHVTEDATIKTNGTTLVSNTESLIIFHLSSREVTINTKSRWLVIEGKPF